ncbi:MAG: hypothetical protein RR931_08120 [Mucinivorans sp.]
MHNIKTNFDIIFDKIKPFAKKSPTLSDKIRSNLIPPTGNF